MTNTLPPSLEKSDDELKIQELDALALEIAAWIDKELPYRNRLQLLINNRDQCRDDKSRVAAESLVAFASISVMSCQRNIELRKNKMIDIMGINFSLVEKYIPAPQAGNTGNSPLQ